KVAQSKSDVSLQIGTESRMDFLIHHGFRARLDAESLVTGILYIDLAMISNAPPPQYHQVTPEYQEIPTMPTEVQQLLSNLAHFHVGRLQENLNKLLTQVDSKLAELNVADINAGITNLLGSANRLVTSEDLTSSLASLRQTLDRAHILVKHVDNYVDP